MRDPLSKYLERFAEPEAAITGIERQYAASIAIPACREEAGDIRAVTAALPDLEGLLVIVVNNTFEPSDAARACNEALTGSHPTHRLSDNAILVRSGSPDLLLVDRFSAGRTISKRHGVGLARKIACDIALALHHHGVVHEPWLYTTDADARLPANFLKGPETNAVARISGFRHTGEPGLETAALLYDIRLLYHTAGLAWAGSPYAYPTIGSLMSFSPRAYAVVRGVPRRSTGEDFYLLNKLRKEGAVAVDGAVTVTLKGRASDRVPVGTGMALTRISALSDPHADYLFEHPACFADLRLFLCEMQVLASEQPPGYHFEDALFHAYSEQSGFYAHYEKKRAQNPTPQVLRKHLADWFDGLKTRQLIHRLRDQRHGCVRADELGTAPFITGNPDTAAAVRQALFHTVYRPAAAR